MLPANLSGLRFLKWYYLPLPRILWELKDMTRELKTNQHNLRMLTVAFSRTDLQLPAMAAVIPKNGSLSQCYEHIKWINHPPAGLFLHSAVAWGVQINMRELYTSSPSMSAQGWWFTLPQPSGNQPTLDVWGVELPHLCCFWHVKQQPCGKKGTATPSPSQAEGFSTNQGFTNASDTTQDDAEGFSQDCWVAPGKFCIFASPAMHGH